MKQFTKVKGHRARWEAMLGGKEDVSQENNTVPLYSAITTALAGLLGTRERVFSFNRQCYIVPLKAAVFMDEY